MPVTKDPYRRNGTVYIHSQAVTRTASNATHNHNDEDDNHKESVTPKSHQTSLQSNPTGAVVPPISLATTFQQSSPGIPNCVNDPASFGMGYEYSRTGESMLGKLMVHVYY